MATLLHIDSSALSQGSASREVTAAFRAAWEEQHPEGTVVYRDLAATLPPHLSAAAITAGFADPATHSEEQRAAVAVREQLIAELEQADAIVIGAPMYNLSIPSTLKAWLDQVVVVGRTAGENPSVGGTPAVVVASRGGAYGPGTPREGFEFVQNYLEKLLGGLLGLDVEFIVPELTMARSVPAMAELVEKADASRAQAHEQAAAKAKELAARLAA
jgi:FMN-dependent NADH-azoreductase